MNDWRGFNPKLGTTQRGRCACLVGALWNRLRSATQTRRGRGWYHRSSEPGPGVSCVAGSTSRTRVAGVNYERAGNLIVSPGYIRLISPERILSLLASTTLIQYSAISALVGEWSVEVRMCDSEIDQRLSPLATLWLAAAVFTADALVVSGRLVSAADSLPGVSALVSGNQNSKLGSSEVAGQPAAVG